MAWLRSLVGYLGIIVTTIVFIEVTSFAVLTYNLTDPQGRSFYQAATVMLKRHPWLTEIVPYGYYDPVVTQRYRPHEYQGRVEVGRNGFIHNGHSDPILNTFPEKLDDVFRIILLGGSSLAGNALRSDNTKTISAFLERGLNAGPVAGNSGLRFQVLNWGYSGAYSFTELVRLFSDGIHVEPDLIMMLDGWNDGVQTSFEHARMGMPHPVLNWGNLHYQYYDRMFGVTSSSIGGPAALTYTSLLLEHLGFLRDTTSRRRDVYRANPVFGLTAALLPGDPRLTRVMLRNWTAIASWCVHSKVGFVAYLQPFAGHRRSAAPSAETAMLEARFQLLASIYGKAWAADAYFASMEDVFARYRSALPDVQRRFADTAARFHDLTGFFDMVAESIYLDQIHYNDRGNELLADRFRRDVEAYLHATGRL